MTEPGASVARLLGVVAGHGLRQRSVEPLTVTVEAPALLDAARRHRITGLVAAAVHDGRLRGPVEWHADVAAAHLAALHTSLRCDLQAMAAVTALTAAGVPHRLLKGVAHAHLDVPDPALRTYGDTDLLVPRGDLPVALATLGRAGWRRTEPPVREWWERRFGKAVVLTGPLGELDLHVTLSGGYFGLVLDADELFREPGETLSLDGLACRALPADHRLVHAAYHAVLGGGSGLRAARDVAQLADDGSLLAPAIQLARRWRGEAVLAAAIARTWATLDLHPDHPAIIWALSHTPTRRDRQRIGASARGGDWAAGEGRRAAAGLPPLHRPAYYAGLAWPSAASLAARGRTRGSHLRHLATTIRRGPTGE